MTVTATDTRTAAQVEFDEGRTAFERREGALGSLRLKYRSVTARIAKLNAGEVLANTDAEFAEMTGRHLAQITARLGWTDTDRWVTQAVNAERERGLTGLLGLINTIAWAICPR